MKKKSFRAVARAAAKKNAARKISRKARKPRGKKMVGGGDTTSYMPLITSPEKMEGKKNQQQNEAEFSDAIPDTDGMGMFRKEQDPPKMVQHAEPWSEEPRPKRWFGSMNLFEFDRTYRLLDIYDNVKDDDKKLLDEYKKLKQNINNPKNLVTPGNPISEKDMKDLEEKIKDFNSRAEKVYNRAREIEKAFLAEERREKAARKNKDSPLEGGGGKSVIVELGDSENIKNIHEIEDGKLKDCLKKLNTCFWSKGNDSIKGKLTINLNSAPDANAEPAEKPADSEKTVVDPPQDDDDATMPDDDDDDAAAAPAGRKDVPAEPAEKPARRQSI